MLAAKPTLSPKQVVRRFLKAMTHGKPGDLSKLASPDIVAIQGAERVQGHPSIESYAAFYRGAYPGWTFEVDRLVAEGSWVAASGRSVAKAAGGGELSVPWLAQYRVTRGRVAEVRMLADTSALEPAQTNRLPLQPQG